MSTFAVLNYSDFSESRPSGQIDVPSTDDARFHVLSGGLVDSDRSGIPDSLQNFIYGTDPGRWNTSGTPLPDGWLIHYEYDALDPGIDRHPAGRPPLEALPGVYGNHWPVRFTPTLWDVYSWDRPDGWDEAEEGPWFNDLDPREWDNSGDGIPDGWLLYYGLDPMEDTIGDAFLSPAGAEGLSVWEAFMHNTNPLLVDTAGSGIPDREEIEGPLNPRYPETEPPRFPPTDPSRFSTIGSGVCDGYLVAHGLDPTDPENAYRDLGRSGATTLEKFNWSHERFGEDTCTQGRGLDPTRFSTTQGPIPDGWLLRYGLDPLDPDITDMVTQSSEDHDDGPWSQRTVPPEGTDLPPLDHVTLTVLDEYMFGRPNDWDEATQGPWWGGTDPSKSDTDNDGLPDSVEIRGFYIGVATDVGPNAELSHYHVSSDPTRLSTSGDALTDWEEIVELSTDPTKRDTAMDGIPDVRYLDETFQEYGLSPIHADSAGDFLRDGERLGILEARAKQYAMGDRSYPVPGEPGVPRKVTDWACSLPGAQEYIGGLDAEGADCEDLLEPEQLAGLFGPLGDVNGNGVVNILDPDIDGDGLLNGWEVHPGLYRHSPFPSPIPRSPTDPLNPDTDGDGLTDGWEVENGRPLHDVGRYSLDPGRWSTLCDLGGDCRSDADQDPDDDGADWPAVEVRGDTRSVRTDVFDFPNILEQQYETDPHVFDTAGDGLADGWKVFWGIVYPTLLETDPEAVGDVRPQQVPDSIRPLPNVPQQDIVLAHGTVTHFFLDDAHVQPGDHVEIFENIPLADATEGTVYRVTRTVTFTHQDAQSAGTNPFLAQTGTLGDGIPDWWKWYYSQLPEGIPVELAECDTGLSLDPLDPGLADRDLDGDGLTVKQEYLLGTNPFCRSTTLTGIQDRMMAGLEPGEEIQTVHQENALDPTRARAFLESQVDSDCDGLFDHEELVGMRYPDLFGSQVIRTDPDNPDTDGDGLLDGRNVIMRKGSGEMCSDPWIDLFIDLGISYRRIAEDEYRFRGEIDQQTHPLDPNDTGLGIPAGWFVSHNLDLNNLPQPREHYWARYSLGMPSWWDHEVHGPWWGGLPPSASGAEVEQYAQDADRDGLLDADKEDGFEDPFPGANWENKWREIPWEDYPEGLGLKQKFDDLAPGAHPGNDSLEWDPLLRRILAQSYLNPREVGSSFVFFPRESLNPPADRIQPCIDFNQSTGLRDAHDNKINAITKGEAAYLVGRVVDSCSATNPTPFYGVTIEVRAGGHSFGAAFSESDGSFRLPVDVVAEHGVVLPEGVPVVLRGETVGTVNWTADPSVIAPGDRFLNLRTYASSDHAPARPALSSSLDTQPFTILADSTLELDAPDAVVTGSGFIVTFQLHDSGGAPLEDPVVFTWAGKERSVIPDPRGRGEIALEARHDMQGIQTLVVQSQPSTSPRQYVETAEASVTILLRQPVDVQIQSAPTVVDAGSTLRAEGRVLFQGQGVSDTEVVLNLTGGAVPVEGARVVTSPAGTFVAALSVPPDAEGGRYVLLATALASDSTVEVETSREVDVRSLPVFVDTQSGSISQGDQARVAARFLEPDGRPIVDASILVRLHNEEKMVVTDSAGRFSIEFSSSLPARPVQQVLEFSGDELRVPVTHRSERAVLATTSLEANSGTLPRGGDLVMPMRLVDAEGAGVEGSTVWVAWGDEPRVPVQTDGSGRAVFHRAGDRDEPVGPVTVRAEYPGSRDGGRAGTATTVVWTVVAQAEIQLPEGAFEAGTPIPFAVLRDAGTGTPLGGQFVVVERGMGDGRELRTDPDGRFPAIEDVNRTSPPKQFVLVARYGGNESYEPVERRSSVVIQTPVALDVHLPSHVVAGREVFVPVRVVGLDGNPVPDGQVNVSLGDRVIGGGVVEQGAVRVPLFVPENATAGPTTFRFSFHNSSLYASAESDEPAHLLRSVTLTFMIEEAAPGETAVIRVRAESAGEVVPFIPIHLQMEGVEGGLRGETNDEGIATFYFEQPDHSVRMAARFSGEEQLHPTHVMGVLDPPRIGTPLERTTFALAYILLGLAVLMGALLPIIHRLRRSPLEPVMERIRWVLGERGPYAQRILAAYRDLEEAALGQGMLFEIARTPRALQEAIEPHIPSGAHGSLDLLISLFEVARYGEEPIRVGHCEAAVAALDRILESMREQAGFVSPARFLASLRRGRKGAVA